MSGGSLDYACWKVENIASELRSRSEFPSHRALADHLDKVAKALHDVEWVLSGDYAAGDETQSVLAVVRKSDIIATVIAEAEYAAARLAEVIRDAKL